jgi:hypothetical protein
VVPGSLCVVVDLVVKFTNFVSFLPHALVEFIRVRSHSTDSRESNTERSKVGLVVFASLGFASLGFGINESFR